MSDLSLIPPAGLPATLPAARPPGPAGSVADVLHQRRHRTGGWTPVKVAAFIEKLAETGSVTRAAAYVRLSTAAAYALRNHPDGAPFAAAWDDAVGARHEMLAEIALDRVRDGVERLRWWKGECVGADRVFSDRLLMFMLDRTDPLRRGGGRASSEQAAAARARVDDAGALDRLLAPPAAPGPAAVPLPGPAGAGESCPGGPAMPRRVPATARRRGPATRPRSTKTTTRPRRSTPRWPTSSPPRPPCRPSMRR